MSSTPTGAAPAVSATDARAPERLPRAEQHEISRAERVRALRLATAAAHALLELRMKDHETQQKQIRALKQEITALRPQGESAAQAIRQKERQLKDLEPGGPNHIPRPFVDKKKSSYPFCHD